MLQQKQQSGIITGVVLTIVESVAGQMPGNAVVRETAVEQAVMVVLRMQMDSMVTHT